MKIVLIGTGNVAMHLGPALIKAGHEVIQLVGRTEKHSKFLANKLSCDYTINKKQISPKADTYIVALRDEAIGLYSKHIPSEAKLVVHTSGSVNANVFSGITQHYGVLYPIQTLSTKRKINFETIPLCLEANSEKAKKKLLTLAKSLSKEVHWTSHDQRQTIHLAAVFANNFSNHLFALAEDMLTKKGMSFDLIRPLIAETAAKVQKSSAHQMQTGPARRGDTETIEKHIELLKNKPQLLQIYKILTRSIQENDGPIL
ncbi:MAG: DUF2520 domain-containing protein [Bacteroidetes bacterium]|nr:MAG: DUF2520 domain-containing protein [Bacteroidota bacterium]